MIGSPTSAKTPAAAATAANETSDVLTTWRRRALVRERGPSQRHARDDPERGRRHRDERRGDEVGVGEARDRAGPEPAREAEADDEEGLEHDRQRRGARQLGEARADVERDTPSPIGTQHNAVSGTRSVTTPFTSVPPGARDDAVLADPPEDHRQADDAPERVAGGRGAVAVEGGERARRERGVEMRDRGRDEEDESVGRRLPRARRQPAGELPRGPAARQQADSERRDCDEA